MPSAYNTRLLAEAKHALETFLSSGKTFQIVRTLPSSPSTPRLDPAQQSSRTLFILDSSFNPPSRAHASLAASAIASARSKQNKNYAAPHRLLILFGTQNADKNPSPAAFEHRLAMMIVFAEELAHRFEDERRSSTEDSGAVPVDVGLSTHAKYTDKSAAIEESRTYHVQSEGPQHIHLAGFDTLVRIFSPKYYPDHDPPLSALQPYFTKNAIRATIRPHEAGWGDSDEQREWLERLRKGEMEDIGAKKEWADKVHLVEADDEGQGVSSTKVRELAQSREHDELKERGLCTKGVFEYIEDMDLYQDA